MNHLHILSFREREIIRMRRGIHGRVYSLEEIGKMFSITKERAAQIEAKAIKKLQLPENPKVGSQCSCEMNILMSNGCQCGGA